MLINFKTKFSDDSSLHPCKLYHKIHFQGECRWDQESVRDSEKFEIAEFEINGQILVSETVNTEGDNAFVRDSVCSRQRDSIVE